MSGASTTVFLPYTLTLRGPAIIAVLSGAPNGAATQQFIPGGAIRGAVAARLLADGEAADSDVFRDLVLTGVVRYLHAYPEIDGQRAMPVPQSWRSEKMRPDRVRDLAAFGGHATENDDAENLKDLWPEEPLVSLGAPFTAPSPAAGKRSVVAPRVDARLHQQRDRVKGRPWTEQVDGYEVPRGAIFSYEYLEPEQVFRGLVQVHLRAASSGNADRMVESRERYVQRVRALLNGKSILVGRSRRAGYGGDAEVRFDSASMDAEYADFAGDLADDLQLREYVRLFLVSAYVGRHPATGQLDPNALVHELRQRGLKTTTERRRWSFETVGSFNQKWHLEVPQATAVSAGSVFVLRTENPVPIALLRSIEREGLGERRVEGFGRVLFLRHDEAAKSLVVRRDAGDFGTNDAADAAQEMAPSVADQLAFVEGRIVLSAARRELGRVAADLMMDFARSSRSRFPTTSLLGRIRTLFRAVRNDPTARQALDNLRTWCDEEGDNALKLEARKKLQGCRNDRETLLEWFRALTESDHDSSAWRHLVEAAGTPTTLSGLAQRHHLTAEKAADAILDGHAAELTVYLIDGVLAAMARRNRGGNR